MEAVEICLDIFCGRWEHKVDLMPKWDKDPTPHIGWVSWMDGCQ
jgi:hypothetical protein